LESGDDGAEITDLASYVTAAELVVNGTSYVSG
jgi:hypothetical protein